MTCTTLVLLKAEESSLAATELMLFTALPLTTSLLAVDTAALLPVLLWLPLLLSTVCHCWHPLYHPHHCLSLTIMASIQLLYRCQQGQQWWSTGLCDVVLFCHGTTFIMHAGVARSLSLVFPSPSPSLLPFFPPSLLSLWLPLMLTMLPRLFLLLSFDVFFIDLLPRNFFL